MNEKPVVIIDTREQTPLPFANLPTEAGTLYSGDYSVKDSETLFSIERKTVKDLCSSVTRGRDRFEHELHRLRGFQFARLLTVAGFALLLISSTIGAVLLHQGLEELGEGFVGVGWETVEVGGFAFGGLGEGVLGEVHEAFELDAGALGLGGGVLGVAIAAGFGGEVHE